MSFSVVLLAAGSGRRLGQSVPKAFVEVFPKKYLIEFSLEIFEQVEEISSVIVVVPGGYEYIVEGWSVEGKYKKIASVVRGGNSRQESSFIGCRVATSDCVLIHDAARPGLSVGLVERIIQALVEYPAVCPIVPAVDSLVLVEGDFVKQRLDRACVGLVQTPQAFRRSVIEQAHEIARRNEFLSATDDVSLVLEFGICEVRCIEGEEQNFKVTYPYDLDRLRLLFKSEKS